MNKKTATILLGLVLVLGAVYQNKEVKNTDGGPNNTTITLNDGWTQLDNLDSYTVKEIPTFRVNQNYKGKSKAKYYSLAERQNAYLTWCLDPRISPDGNFGIFYTNRDFFIKHYIDKENKLSKNIDNRYSIVLKNINTNEETILISDLLETSYLTTSWWIDNDRFIYMMATSDDNLEPKYVVCDTKGNKTKLDIPKDFIYTLSTVENYLLTVNPSHDKSRLYSIDEANNLVLLKEISSYETIETGEISKKENKVLLGVSDGKRLKLKIVDLKTGKEKMVDNPIKDRNTKLSTPTIGKYYFKDDNIVYTCNSDNNDKGKYYFVYNEEK